MAENNILTQIQELDQYEVSQRHSYFQLKYFLIGKEPTLQSKMWQCLREIKVRKDTLNSIELEREEQKDKLELLNINAEKIRRDLESLSSSQEKNADLQIMELNINLRQQDRKKKAILETLKQLDEREKSSTEETRFFYETFKNLEKIEPLRHYDDLEAQKNYWHEKLTQKTNLRLLTQNKIDTELIETIIALPDDVPIKQQTLQNLTARQEHLMAEMQKLVDQNKVQLRPKES